MGPGILFAFVTMAGSHLVQSTFAGADYGLKIIPFIFLIYILKYPFFEFAQRYTNVTQQTLLQGYLQLGRFTLILFTILVAITSFATIAAISLLTSNVIAYLFNATISPLVFSIALLSLCCFILLIGNYPWLDRIIKLIFLILIIATFTTFYIAISKGSHELIHSSSLPVFTLGSLPFLVALTGWMPAPIEASVWTTLWTRARNRLTHYHPTLKETLIDLKIGYLISLVLAIMFVVLGAVVILGSGENLSDAGIIFVEQLLTLYTTNIGKWSEPIIALALFCIMFSSLLTCLDAYPRSLAASIVLLFPNFRNQVKLLYWVLLILLFFISVIFSGAYYNRMKELLDFATTLSALAAPIFGYMNYRVVTNEKLMPKQSKPSLFLILHAKLGLLFLLCISIFFILNILFPIRF